MGKKIVSTLKVKIEKYYIVKAPPPPACQHCHCLSGSHHLLLWLPSLAVLLIPELHSRSTPSVPLRVGLGSLDF